MNNAVKFIIGGFLGLLVVRGFFLDPIEEMGWRLFWEAVSSGNLGVGGKGWDMVLSSATFAKSMVGFFIGGGLSVVGTLFYNKSGKHGD